MLRLLTTADTEILAAAHAVRGARPGLPRGALREPGRRRRARRAAPGRPRRRRPAARRPARVARRRRRAARALRGATGSRSCCSAARPSPTPSSRSSRWRPPARSPRRSSTCATAASRTRASCCASSPTRSASRATASPRARPLADLGVYVPGAATSPRCRSSTRRARASASSSTARTASPGTRRSSTRWRRRSSARAARPRACGPTRCARTAAGASPLSICCGGKVDALVTTVLASGGSHGAQEWHAEALEALGVPVIQALCATTSRERWAAADGGLTPLDAAMQVAIPEFDGRIVGVPVSFKEPLAGAAAVGTEVLHYAPDLERCDRLARLAVRHAGLATLPRDEQRMAIVLSSFPTKHARVGNAVGLDTPASAIVLLDALAAAGHRVEHAVRGRRRARPRAHRRGRPRPRVPVGRRSSRRRPRGCRSPTTRRGSPRSPPRCARRWWRRGARRPASGTSTGTTS